MTPRLYQHRTLTMLVGYCLSAGAAEPSSQPAKERIGLATDHAMANLLFAVIVRWFDAFGSA